MAVLAAVAVLLLAGAASAAGARGRRADAAVAVRVAVDPLAPGKVVPAHFLGLSFEAAALGQISRYAHRGDLVTLLRSLGPGVIRFGGITADEDVAWTDGLTPRPPWASLTIGPPQMRAVGELARRSGWHVLLTVNLAHYDPEAAAREVASASHALGPLLAGVEIGNEPNSYASHGLRENPWLAQGYEEEVAIYREAIAALTPGVPIAGPDVSGSGIFKDWGEAEALAQVPSLLTGHHYPLGCAQVPPPSIQQLLSPATRGLEERSLATYLSVSLLNDIPLRIDEANTVSCGGVPGISDTFASALWAAGYITQVMASGTAGINLEGNPTNCVGYTPLCAPSAAALAAGRLRAQPEWYALLLTRSLTGARPLPTSVQSDGSPDLVVAAFSGPGRSIQDVLVDDEPPGSRPLAVKLDAAGMGEATVLRLTAPSQSSTGDVLLGGHTVAANGSFRVKGPTVAVHGASMSLKVTPSSAVLVTLTPGRHSRRRG